MYTCILASTKFSDYRNANITNINGANINGFTVYYNSYKFYMSYVHMLNCDIVI